MRRVAVAQLVSSDNLDENLNVLHGLFSQASDAGAQLLVLPENFAFMGRDELGTLALVEAESKPEGTGLIQQTLSNLSCEYNIWVVAGTVPLKAPDGRAWASSLVFNSEGVQVARYDKIHLFDVELSEGEIYQESKTYASGTKPVVVDTPIGRLGLSVCYDVRFPELYRELVNQGAEVFTMVAAFTATTGAAHWHTLLRARAIENMSYMLASDQGGMHANGRETYGHSLIVDPWGKILSEIKHGTGLIFTDIDLEYLHERRAAFPCLDHRIL
ncbi:MAG: carbon-nitrogen hydrolase family protein [Legionellaceae bacterium]|nr:carbon-nitrogen hydrolase family protein [Legionellaceae bacterium]